jgi:hypothetical protein
MTTVGTRKQALRSCGELVAQLADGVMTVTSQLRRCLPVPAWFGFALPRQQPLPVGTAAPALAVAGPQCLLLPVLGKLVLPLHLHVNTATSTAHPAAQPRQRPRRLSKQPPLFCYLGTAISTVHLLRTESVCVELCLHLLLQHTADLQHPCSMWCDAVQLHRTSHCQVMMTHSHAAAVTAACLFCCCPAVNQPGFSYSIDSTGTPSAVLCGPGTYSPGLKKQRACVPCPSGFTTDGQSGARLPSACGRRLLSSVWCCLKHFILKYSK